jgi:N-acetylglucosamine kinase-like BadF-type ATPase
LKIDDPWQLVPAVYGKLDRAAIAALAPLVLEAAEASDPVAYSVIWEAAQDLAEMVATVARQLELTGLIPLALAGGVLTGSRMLRDSLRDRLNEEELTIWPIDCVSEPARGAVRLAAEALAGKNK